MIQEGKSIPAVTFQTRVRNEAEDYDWKDVKTSDLFSGKRVVMFALPGAFTPTCSSFQLPGFDLSYNDFKANGIDEVYCLSVNDSFVMNAWFRDQKIQNVKPIPDGNAIFTASMGMLVSKVNLGFGKRSWRYAAVIDDGVIEKLFVEDGFRDNADTDPYRESTPESVLEYVKSNVKEPALT